MDPRKNKGDFLFKSEIVLKRFATKERAWSNTVVTNSKIFSVTKANPQSILQVGRVWLQGLQDSPSPDLVESTVWLACQLFSTIDHEASILVDDALGDKANFEMITNPYFDARNSGDSYKKIMKTPQAPPTENDEEAPTSLQDLRKPATTSRPSGENLFLDLGIDSAYEVLFYPFYAACLMRASVKVENTITGKIGRMLEQFSGFYGCSIAIDSQTFQTPSDVSLKTLRISLRQATPLLHTFLSRAIIAEKHSAEQDQGLLRFCAVQYFYLAGMHLYSQFHDCCLAIQLQPVFFCSMISYQAVYPSIIELLTVLRKYENSEKEEDDYWQFARSYGTGFFQTIQTKNNQELVYLFAYIVKEYVGGTNNPTQIAAIAGISGKKKTMLEKIGKAVIRFVMPNMMLNVRADNTLKDYIDMSDDEESEDDDVPQGLASLS